MFEYNYDTAGVHDHMGFSSQFLPLWNIDKLTVNEVLKSNAISYKEQALKMIQAYNK